ncbi:hypothetical protein HDU93_002532 [Gonapodya sp. JEL0774]|nr:hypothetical protein HDU93_002532 [Gonapodya sp. JEL0774]
MQRHRDRIAQILHSIIKPQDIPPTLNKLTSPFYSPVTSEQDARLRLVASKLRFNNRQALADLLDNALDALSNRPRVQQDPAVAAILQILFDLARPLELPQDTVLDLIRREDTETDTATDSVTLPVPVSDADLFTAIMRQEPLSGPHWSHPSAPDALPELDLVDPDVEFDTELDLNRTTERAAAATVLLTVVYDRAADVDRGGEWKTWEGVFGRVVRPVLERVEGCVWLAIGASVEAGREGQRDREPFPKRVAECLKYGVAEVVGHVNRKLVEGVAGAGTRMGGLGRVDRSHGTLDEFELNRCLFLHLHPDLVDVVHLILAEQDGRVPAGEIEKETDEWEFLDRIKCGVKVPFPLSLILPPHALETVSRFFSFVLQVRYAQNKCVTALLTPFASNARITAATTPATTSPSTPLSRTFYAIRLRLQKVLDAIAAYTLGAAKEMIDGVLRGALVEAEDARAVLGEKFQILESETLLSVKTSAIRVHIIRILRLADDVTNLPHKGLSPNNLLALNTKLHTMCRFVFDSIVGLASHGASRKLLAYAEAFTPGISM